MSKIISLLKAVMSQDMNLFRYKLKKKSSKIFDIANFRAIALLPNITKIINSLIKCYLEESIGHLIPDNSFGFRKQLSTTHCLNALIHKIVSAI